MIMLLVAIIAILPAGFAIRYILNRFHCRKYEPFTISNPQKMTFVPVAKIEDLAFINPFTKWPRNLSCFCGSGQKSKKCCNSKIPTRVKQTQVAELNRDFKKCLTKVEMLRDQGIVYKLDNPVL